MGIKGVIRGRLIEIVVCFPLIVIAEFVVVSVRIALEAAVMGEQVVLIIEMPHVQLTVFLCEWIVVFFLKIQIAGEMRSELFFLPAAIQCRF